MEHQILQKDLRLQRFKTMKNFKKKLAGILMFSMLLATTPAGFVFADLSSDTVSSTTPTATVTTGDTASVTDVENAVNTSNITDNPQPTTDNQEQTSTGEVAESLPISTESLASTTPQNTSADIVNEATVSNDVAGLASTGENSSVSNDGNASIETGTAVSVVNVANVVNTTIFDSQGFILLLNSLFGEVGTIDTRLFMSGNSDSTIPCGGNCSFFPSQTSLNASSTASITNNIIARANTGGNEAEGDNAFVGTGDAFAGVNLVNIANTNITNSSYMLVAFNNFGDWGGDLVLPGKDFWSKFFNPRAPSLNQNGDGQGASVSVNNENSANVENGVDTVADTGGNEAEGDSASVDTGNAVSSTNVVNQVNKNLFGSDSFLVVFRVFGNWTGNVFSAPPGMSWTESEGGLQIMYDEEAAATGYESEDDSGEGGSSGGEGGGPSSVSVRNNNRADIKNNVQVFALTGANKAQGDSGAEVETGNAYAGANIVNLANTNIFGRNWILAIFNIFGDWSGDVAFGRPDLWVGTEIERRPEGFTSGSPVEFKFTVANLGDADATNVYLNLGLNNDKLAYFHGANYRHNRNNREIARYYLGNIPAGEFREFNQMALVRDVPYGGAQLVSTAEVTSYEPDGSFFNNTDIAGFGLYSDFREAVQGVQINYEFDPKLSVSKLNNAPFGVYASSTVGYTIVVENKGGPAYYAILKDVLKNEAGEAVGEQTWDLGTVLPNEEITVNYGTFFNPNAPPGKYTNFAEVKAVGRSSVLEPFYGNHVSSGVATSSIVMLAPDEVPEIPADVILPEPEEAPATTTIDRVIKPAPQTPLSGGMSKKPSPFPALLPQALPPSPPVHGSPLSGLEAAVIVGAKPLKLPKDLSLAALLIALAGVSLNRFNPEQYRQWRNALTTFFW